MIDWHSHILPGIDDGAAELGQSLVMASSLASAGFQTVYCTPHLIRGCYEAGNDQVRRGVDQLQEQLDTAGIALRLRAGREYCLDEFLLNYLDDPLLLDDKSLILVELPAMITVDLARQLMYGVVKSGFKPLIAHPERCHLLEPAACGRSGRGFVGTLKGLFAGGGHVEHDDQCDTAGNPLLDYLRDLGCLFQGNLGSFKGLYGRHVKKVAEALHKKGVYDRYGSDLHDPEQSKQMLSSPFPN